MKNTKQFAIASLFEQKNYITVYHDVNGGEAGRITREGKKYKAQQLTGKQLTALCNSIKDAKQFIRCGHSLWGNIITQPTKEATRFAIIMSNEHGQRKQIDICYSYRDAVKTRNREERHREGYIIEIHPMY